MWAGYVDHREDVVPLATLIGGAIGIWLLYIRARAADRQARTAEQGHITDRFTAAVEQLGSDKMAVRLGAIYALERISKDSRRDHWTIMETLTAYVRENAKRQWDKIAKHPEAEVSAADIQAIIPVADIQAVLTVLGRRDDTASEEDEAQERFFNLRGVRFSVPARTSLTPARGFALAHSQRGVLSGRQP